MILGQIYYVSCFYIALSLLVYSTPNMSHARYFFTLQIIFELANLLAPTDPALAVCLTTLFSQLDQRWPIYGVIIAELNLATHGFHELTRRNVLT